MVLQSQTLLKRFNIYIQNNTKSTIINSKTVEKKHYVILDLISNCIGILFLFAIFLCTEAKHSLHRRIYIRRIYQMSVQYTPSIVHVCVQSRRTILLHSVSGGAVASWLVRSTPEQIVQVRALAGDNVLCSWARHFYFHGTSFHPSA